MSRYIILTLAFITCSISTGEGLEKLITWNDGLGTEASITCFSWLGYTTKL